MKQPANKRMDQTKSVPATGTTPFAGHPRCSADLSSIEAEEALDEHPLGGVRMLTIEELADTVSSRDTFLAFVEAVAADRESDAAGEAEHPSNPYGPTAKGWGNTTIHDFLEAAVACARDGKRLSEQPSWREIALFLLGGKAYE